MSMKDLLLANHLKHEVDKKIAKLTAENERLRAALEKLAQIDVDDGEYNSVWEQVYAVKRIAKDALEVGK